MKITQSEGSAQESRDRLNAAQAAYAAAAEELSAASRAVARSRSAGVVVVAEAKRSLLSCLSCGGPVVADGLYFADAEFVGPANEVIPEFYPYCAPCAAERDPELAAAMSVVSDRMLSTLTLDFFDPRQAAADELFRAVRRVVGEHFDRARFLEVAR